MDRLNAIWLWFQKADLAIADLTITYEREQAVDFTMPFMNLGMKKQNAKKDCTLTCAFLDDQKRISSTSKATAKNKLYGRYLKWH